MKTLSPNKVAFPGSLEDASQPTHPSSSVQELWTCSLDRDHTVVNAGSGHWSLHSCDS